MYGGEENCGDWGLPKFILGKEHIRTFTMEGIKISVGGGEYANSIVEGGV